MSLSQVLQVPYEGFDVEFIDLDNPSELLMYNDVNEILKFAFNNK